VQRQGLLTIHSTRIAPFIHQTNQSFSRDFSGLGINNPDLVPVRSGVEEALPGVHRRIGIHERAAGRRLQTSLQTRDRGRNTVPVQFRFRHRGSRIPRRRHFISFCPQPEERPKIAHHAESAINPSDPLFHQRKPHSGLLATTRGAPLS